MAPTACLIFLVATAFLDGNLDLDGDLDLTSGTFDEIFFCFKDDAEAWTCEVLLFCRVAAGDFFRVAGTDFVAFDAPFWTFAVDLGRPEVFDFFDDSTVFWEVDFDELCFVNRGLVDLVNDECEDAVFFTVDMFFLVECRTVEDVFSFSLEDSGSLLDF